MDLARLREEIEALTIAHRRIGYRDRAGLAATTGLAALFRAAPEVATWETLSQVREAIPSTEGRRATRLRALSHQVVTLLASRDGWQREEAWARAAMTPVSGTAVGEEWPLRVGLHQLAHEQNREARAEAERRTLAAVQETEPVLARWQEGVRATFGRAGWTSPGAAWSADHDFDVQLLAAGARTFLADTEGMYRDVLAWWLRRSVGLSPFPYDAERHDLLHALTLREFRGLFPNRSDLTRALDPFLKSGVDLSMGGRLRFDSEGRAGKQIGAFVAVIDPPEEVIAVVRPEAGFVAVRDLLGVWGTGQHLASIDANRPFEDRLLGDTAVPAAFGRLYQAVLLDKLWLRRALGEEPPDLRRVIALQELFRLRHAAVVLLASLETDASGPGREAQELFDEQASATLGARWPGALLRWECDVGLEAATGLLAAALEARLFPHVREQFDEDWWANPRATLYLQKLSSQGQLESARTLASTLGLGEVSLTPLVARFQAALG